MNKAILTPANVLLAVLLFVAFAQMTAVYLLMQTYHHLYRSCHLNMKRKRTLLDDPNECIQSDSVAAENNRLHLNP